MTNPSLRLGLIGDNIAQSRSPLLHRLAGGQRGIDVTYDSLIPKAMGLNFDEVFARVAEGGYRGVNVTYPYKEKVVAKLTIDDPMVRAVGAVNTVVFEADGPKGYNTDYSGFMAAYRRERGEARPGAVLMIGTGGVGRAIAYGLVELGARELRLVDRDAPKAAALADELAAFAPGTTVAAWGDAEAAAVGVQGLVNSTPVGMVGYGGTPLPGSAMTGVEWAFDAVYTPTDTQFLGDAAAAGAALISGWELFFYQGVHAWKHFSGTPLDEAALRSSLLSPGEVA